METAPYSIYINHRPFRIVFLLRPATDVAWIDAVIKFNREKWGGRFNPIVFTDGATIADDWWRFLRGYDPDVICSAVPLTDELRKKIHIFLSPLRVEELQPDQIYIRVDDYPITILPTGRNVSRVGFPHFDEKNNLIVFEVDNTTPEVIKSFLDRNFGLLEQGQMMPYHLKKALDTCDIKKYKVVSEETLNDALMDLGEWRTRAIFPSQICALPNSIKEAHRAYDNEGFEIAVGDSADEMVRFWNRTLEMGSWLRTSITNLWLPTALANSVALKAGLGKFINHYAGSAANNDNQRVRFISFTLSENEIQTIANSFQATIWHPRQITKLTSHPMPDYESQGSHFFLRQGLDFHRAHSNEEYIVLDEPDIEQGFMGGENWFTDLYVQYRPERFKNIMGRDYWWQLPKRNSLLRDLRFFNKPARINEYGMFSVMMKRRTNIMVGPEDETLLVKIPEDNSVFHALICGESFDCIERRDRERFLSQPFYHLRRSDKGMYLSGVLGLFPDLLNAHRLFEERYWRNLFERMANHNPEKDNRIQQELLNKLSKKIDSGLNLKNDHAKQWLAHNVFNIAKKYSKEEIDLDYETMCDLAKEETDKYNEKPSGQAIEFGESDFRNELSDLVGINILQLGIKPRCHKCGYRIWYRIDDAKQDITCRGCGYEFAVPAESKWFYRLNSLIRAAVSLHGTVPLLITLGQLMDDARSSAIFMPSIELLQKEGGDKKMKPYCELDLVCIKDGKFVIGEVKQSVGLFGPDDFKRMKDVAEMIRPDVIVFSSLDIKPNTLVIKSIEKLKNELANLEISVEWYPINYWVFEPRPVR
jgi:hypothetical protein